MKRVLSILSLVALTMAFVTPVFAVEQKEWTLAVFLNADNNLDPFGVEDQNEMAKVGSSDFLNIVTLIDRERGPACYNFIEKGNVRKLQDLGEVDMGDYRLLVNFTKWVVENYPAKHYAFVVWNHGSGWKKKGIKRGISYDDSSNNHITTEQLGVALDEMKKIIGHNVDILDFDACLMQMAEVLYVCQGKVDYVMASEETEPGKGAPYDDILTTLTKTTPVEEFGKNWVKAFCASYNNGSQGYEACTQSFVKVAEMAGVIDAMNGFAKATMAGKYNSEFQTALNKVQKFAEPENIDLLHLVSLLKPLIKDEGFQTAANKVVAALKKAVVANGNIDASMKNAKGMAVYFPADSYAFDDKYKELDFSKNTFWDDMILDFFKKKTVTTMVGAVESGNVAALRTFVKSSKNRELNAYVAEALNFRLFSEGGLSNSVVEEASALVKELTAR